MLIIWVKNSVCLSLNSNDTNLTTVKGAMPTEVHFLYVDTVGWDLGVCLSIYSDDTNLTTIKRTRLTTVIIFNCCYVRLKCQSLVETQSCLSPSLLCSVTNGGESRDTNV